MMSHLVLLVAVFVSYVLCWLDALVCAVLPAAGLGCGCCCGSCYCSCCCTYVAFKAAPLMERVALSFDVLPVGSVDVVFAFVGVQLFSSCTVMFGCLVLVGAMG